MAIFRAVENRRSMVRSTASGQTCAVDAAGRVISLAPPFSEAWINVEIPLVKEDTFYTKHGDYLGIIFTAAAVILLLFGTVTCIIRTYGSQKKNSSS
jgi:apolipoprotein N-acyltransferase